MSIFLNYFLSNFFLTMIKKNSNMAKIVRLLCVFSNKLIFIKNRDYIRHQVHIFCNWKAMHRTRTERVLCRKSVNVATRDFPDSRLNGGVAFIESFRSVVPIQITWLYWSEYCWLAVVEVVVRAFEVLVILF